MNGWFNNWVSTTQPDLNLVDNCIRWDRLAHSVKDTYFKR